MTSAVPGSAEMPRVAQNAIEGCSLGFGFQYPKAPKKPLEELPLIDEPTQNYAVNDGNNQWIPEVLLFCNDIHPKIDPSLGYQNGTRAVVQPCFTCMPEIPEYLWGAVGIPVIISGETTTRVDFGQALDIATVPPVIQMMIRTDTDNLISVDAEQGGPFVTVVDVQRAVIRWMKETRNTLGVNNFTRRFSKWVRMADDDGTEIEVEVSVRGLRRYGREAARKSLDNLRTNRASYIK